MSWEQTEVRWYTYTILILFAQEVPQIALKLKSTILRQAKFLAYPKRQKKNKKIVSKNQGNILSIEMPKNEK